MLLTQLGGWTEDMWSAIIGLFSFIPNWGWMIIVFTICLKLVLSPLDFWQRKIARKNAQKQAIIQPELEKLQKKFGNNKQLLNQKTMELYKRENFSLMGSCVGMLLNMALTLFIFFTLFTALTGMSNSQIVKQYDTIENEYSSKFCETFEVTKENEQTKQDEIFNSAIEYAKTELGKTEIDDEVYKKAIEIMYSGNYEGATEEDNLNFSKIKSVQDYVLEKYNSEIKQSFLWVKNIWRPDTASSVFADFESYNQIAKIFETQEYKDRLQQLIGTETNQDVIKTITKNLKSTYKNDYNIKTFAIQQSYQGTWNGYFILVILAGVITFLSVKFSQMQSTKKDKAQPVQTNKAMNIMKFMLPVLMVIFTIGYSTAFALYIVTNSIMSTLISFVLLKIFEHNEKNKKITISPNKNRPEYSREGM